MLEKIFSTLHASNIILQQEYMQRNFTKYLELISVLLTAEKTNELLKNHNLRPIRSAALPEAHANVNKSSSHFRGRKRRQGIGFHRGGDRSNPSSRQNPQK